MLLQLLFWTLLLLCLPALSSSSSVMTTPQLPTQTTRGIWTSLKAGLSRLVGSWGGWCLKKTWCGDARFGWPIQFREDLFATSRDLDCYPKLIVSWLVSWCSCCFIPVCTTAASALHQIQITSPCALLCCGDYLVLYKLAQFRLRISN